MSKTNSNALAGLIGSYGDSGDESDDGGKISGSRFNAAPVFSTVPPPGMIPSVLAKTGMHNQPPPSMHQNYASPGQAPPMPPNAVLGQEATGPTIHPAPIAHCPWSACYDEGSGFTYYWNQTTNAVTWEAPPEYLLALKLAQQQLHTSGTTEVSAAEWQLYQQALIEKQNAAKITMKPAPAKPKKEKTSKEKNGKVHNRKRCRSEDENEKIELITSYHNSDSESDPEPEIPVKVPEVKPPPLPLSKPPKVPHKKAKIKPIEYGPVLPPKQNYTVPIGPEMPTELVDSPKAEVDKVQNEAIIEDIPVKVEGEDSQDESSLLQQLKDKAKLLEKLGGELPTGLEKIIKDTKSGTSTPVKTIDDIKSSDIDDLLEEIEKKEMPKSKSKKFDMFDENSHGSNDSYKSSIKSGTSTPVTPKPLFPSSKNIDEAPTLFPSAAKIEEVDLVVEKDNKTEAPPIVAEKKGTNLYLADPSEPIERTRKKLRISNSVLPERKKTEMPSYTTKYSQHIEGFSSERVGLGFSQDSDSVESPKAKTVSYGNGLTFTKGEVLNEKDNDLENLTDLVEAKLKHLNELQPGVVSPVQEMLIQMQTLRLAWVGGALDGGYWRRWAQAAAAALAAHEARAPPPGWTCRFQRSAGRYQYLRADGFEQWEYPAVPDTDMDICTTPPPPVLEEELLLPPPPPPPAPAPPPPPASMPPRGSPSPPRTPPPPPPPAWHDPPPPGCDDLPPLPPPEPKKQIKPTPPKQEIGDELLSFYNDLAQLEMQAPPAPPPAPSPPPLVPPPLVSTPLVPPPLVPPARAEHRQRESVERETTSKSEKDKDKLKKKSKLKMTNSMGMKMKTVSNMVAKWQQVADEIHSD